MTVTGLCIYHSEVSIVCFHLRVYPCLDTSMKLTVKESQVSPSECIIVIVRDNRSRHVTAPNRLPGRPHKRWRQKMSHQLHFFSAWIEARALCMVGKHAKIQWILGWP